MNTQRPGALIPPGWERMVQKARGLARTEEDVMTYALFPEIAREFLKKK